MTDWPSLQAPSLAEMEDLARTAFERLPDAFRALCRDLVIRVDDFPDDETLREMDCESEFDLLGLFRGIGLAQGPATNTAWFSPRSSATAGDRSARLRTGR